LLFALARVGAILLPINFRLAPPEWDQLVVQCGPRHIVYDPAWADAARALAQRHGAADHAADDLMGANPAGSAPECHDANAPVLLVHTSGTTQQPRAAVHTQANLMANMRIAALAQGITPQDRVATMLPLFHVGGLCIQTLPALGAGAHVLLHARFDAAAAFDTFERERPTLTLQVPATMKALVEHPRWAAADLTSLRAVWAGSSVLPAPLIAAFHSRGLPVCNVYGATETGPFSIALPPQHAMTHAGSCGWPAPEVQARIASTDGGVGEVLMRGPNVVERYWPDEVAVDAEGWFHTGDLASMAADGSFTIVGRSKDLIISGGENIHPSEIENVLCEHEAVLECAAFALTDAVWGETVAVAVVRRPGAEVTESELRGLLEARIARYKWPRRWFWSEALPKTALGKVQRQQLARLHDPLQTEASGAASRPAS
jgi:fatty-acyl-CoA synthase